MTHGQSTSWDAPNATGRFVALSDKRISESSNAISLFLMYRRRTKPAANRTSKSPAPSAQIYASTEARSEIHRVAPEAVAISPAHACAASGLAGCAAAREGAA